MTRASETDVEPIGPATTMDLGRLLVVVILVGIAAGVGGAALTKLLHLVQHLAYGYTEATFLTGVEEASPARRVAMMTLGGLVVGLGWWWLRARHTVVTVSQGMKNKDPRLPLFSTIADAVLQVIAVGFGGSLGREGAPRQVGAALGAWIAGRARLNATQQRTLLACGAGAGLAAVYNVPLAGALFTLEVLLVSFAIRDILYALITSSIATGVAWTVLPNEPTYIVEPFAVTGVLVVFGILFGPIAGLVGTAFTKIINFANRLPTPQGWRLPIVTTIVFAGVGVLAIPFPQLLGNGKGPAELAFEGGLTLTMFAVLILLKPVVTSASLASGAVGGTLTPSIATGAMLGALTGGWLSTFFPGTPTGAFALIGAAAFLAATHRAPVMAIALVIELTHSGAALLVPMMIAVVVASVVSRRVQGLHRTED